MEKILVNFECLKLVIYRDLFIYFCFINIYLYKFFENVYNYNFLRIFFRNILEKKFIFILEVKIGEYIGENFSRFGVFIISNM